MEYLGSSKPLCEWIKHLNQLSDEGRLYVKKVTTVLSIATSCWNELFEPSDFSNDEYENFENWLDDHGYLPLLGTEQIEDVLENLKQQDPHYTDKQAVDALNHYWVNDAFIQVASAY